MKPPSRLRLRAEAPLEHSIQRSVCKTLGMEIGPPGHLSKHNVCWFCVDHAAFAGIPGIRMSRGIIAGVPDLFLLYRGLTFFIELKRIEIGTVSGPQQWLLPVLAAAGSRVGVAGSAFQVLALLDAWGVPRAGFIKDTAA